MNVQRPVAPKFCRYPCCMEKLVGSGNKKYCPQHARVIEYNNRQERLKIAREEKQRKQALKMSLNS